MLDSTPVLPNYLIIPFWAMSEINVKLARSSGYLAHLGGAVCTVSVTLVGRLSGLSRLYDCRERKNGVAAPALSGSV